MEAECGAPAECRLSAPARLEAGCPEEVMVRTNEFEVPPPGAGLDTEICGWFVGTAATSPAGICAMTWVALYEV